MAIPLLSLRDLRARRPRTTALLRSTFRTSSLGSADRQFGREYGIVTRPRAAWAHTTINTRDAKRSAEFWGALLDIDPVKRSDGWYVLGPTAVGGPMLYFQPVSDHEGSSTRAHVDLWVDDLPNAIRVIEELGGQVAVRVTPSPGACSL